jgi:polysaccharide export outer membrane protein
MNEIHRFFGSKYLFALVFLTAVVSCFSSCKIYKPAYYFRDIQKDTVISGFVTNDFEIRIRKNDILNISISSLSSTEDLIFNKAVSAASDAKSLGFQVNPDGYIYLHRLGQVMAAGLTRKELKAKLENDLLPFLKDPIVAVSFANHRVTVLGEANSTVVEMPEEKIPLLEVMAKTNAATQNSKLNNLMIIRESGNTKEVKNLNLEDPSIFTSPWYYLQPNDIVVVKPNEEKIEDEQKRTSNQLLYGTIITGLTFLLVIIDRIAR